MWTSLCCKVFWKEPSSQMCFLSADSNPCIDEMQFLFRASNSLSRFKIPKFLSSNSPFFSPSLSSNCPCSCLRLSSSNSFSFFCLLYLSVSSYWSLWNWMLYSQSIVSALVLVVCLSLTLKVSILWRRISISSFLVRIILFSFTIYLSWDSVSLSTPFNRSNSPATLLFLFSLSNRVSSAYLNKLRCLSASCLSVCSSFSKASFRLRIISSFCLSWPARLSK